MVVENKQYITIKGTRDGLAFFLDDSCAFQDVYDELKEKIATIEPKPEEPKVPVVIKLGNRYLPAEQKEMLLQMIEEGNGFTIQSFESDVIHKREVTEWKESSTLKVFNQIVRSGQVLETTGDLLLIGDVNPGGKVVTTGNIFIMGSLHGIAHAGFKGDQDAVIAASFMKPTQLRIADYISRAPDYESEGVYMECGYVDEDKDKIVIDRLQVLARKRKSLYGFERGMQNG